MSPELGNTAPVSWPRRAGAAALIVLCWLPVAYLALLSLARDWAFPALLPTALTLATWQRALAGNDGLITSFATSVGIALLVATLATTAAGVASRIFAYHRHRGWWVLAMHAPFALSPVILGTCLLYFFIRLGLVGSAAGVIAAQFIFGYAYAVIVLVGFWNPHVAALEDLARTLGAGKREVLRRVVFPLARPLLAVAFFQTFLLSWFDYGLAAVIGAGKVPVLTLRVTEYMGSGNVHLAAVCALLLVVPPLAFLLLNRRLAITAA